MKIEAVLTYLTRNAGGMYESVRHLHQATAQLPGVSIEVNGLADEYIATDLPAWQPLPVHVYPTSGPRQIQYAPGLGRHLRKTDADLLHTHGLWTYPSHAVAAWHNRRRRPYVISPHGMLDPWAVRNSGWKKKIALALYEREHLAKAACLRALCDSEAASMREFGLTNPICVIPNGITLPRDDTSAVPAPFAEFARGRNVLLYLGRIHPKKGLEHLLQAWQAARIEGWMLAIAGWDQGGYEERLRRFCTEAGLLDSVQFLGPQFREAKAACFRDSDAFILPSFSEGLPMVVLEAWSYGKPVLMTPECNLPEGFSADAALRIEVTADSIAEGLRELAAMSGEARREMGRRGYALARDRFTWPKIAEQMREIYAWLLGQSPRPSTVHTV